MTAKTNKERQQAYRDKKRLVQGLTEVRGIYAAKSQHAAIKAAAKELLAAKASSRPRPKNPSAAA